MNKVEAKKRKITRRKGIRKTLALIASITKTPITGKQERGFAAEEKAYLAARYWQKKKIIKDVRQTEGLSPEDLEMKDLMLTLLNGKEVPIQVKDYFPKSWMRRKCREKGIFLFSIRPFEGQKIARKRMLDLIISAYLYGYGSFEIRKIISGIQEMKQLLSTPNEINLKEEFISLVRRNLKEEFISLMRRAF